MNLIPQPQIGYCTNVHAGATLEQVKRNLKEFSHEIKKLVSPESPLGIGMWFSSACALQLSDIAEVEAIKSLLEDFGLVPFTFNGFPFGDFHQPVVKHKVYQPTWADEPRLDYTIRLAEIQSQLLSDEIEGSISTLPLAWPTDGFSRLWNDGDLEIVEQSAINLKKCANALHRIFEQTGSKIRVAIEPEPGCLIDNCDGVVAFFNQYLLEQESGQNDLVREYIGICHDVCHSAVMFESQRDALKTYADNHIRVVKVQVSSAIEMPFVSLDHDQRTMAIEQLAQFAEDRYLHQTSVNRSGVIELFEDLPSAIERAEPEGIWRVHYHVPIFAERFGMIGTTQSNIGDCIRAMREFHPLTNHFEIETYAWNVLPEELKEDSLQSGIAKEIAWFAELVSHPEGA